MTKSFLNSEEIKKLLPHRYPFLLVDKVISLTPDEEIIAIKNLTINEEVFSGHFPSEAIFPGVLSVEACAQAAGILCAYSNLLKINNLIESELSEKSQNKVFGFLNKDDLPSLDSMMNNSSKDNNSQAIFYLATIDETKFRKPMFPGASLFIKAKVLQKRNVMWKFSAEIWIDNEELAVQTNFSAFLTQN